MTKETVRNVDRGGGNTINSDRGDLNVIFICFGVICKVRGKIFLKNASMTFKRHTDRDFYFLPKEILCGNSQFKCNNYRHSAQQILSSKNTLNEKRKLMLNVFCGDKIRNINSKKHYDKYLSLMSINNSKRFGEISHVNLVAK